MAYIFFNFLGGPVRIFSPFPPLHCMCVGHTGQTRPDPTQTTAESRSPFPPSRDTRDSSTRSTGFCNTLMLCCSFRSHGPATDPPWMDSGPKRPRRQTPPRRPSGRNAWVSHSQLSWGTDIAGEMPMSSGVER